MTWRTGPAPGLDRVVFRAATLEELVLGRFTSSQPRVGRAADRVA